MSALAPIPPQNSPFLTVQASSNLLQELLEDKRSPNTRRAYEKDLTHFFVATVGAKPSQDLIMQFLQLERFTAIAIVLKFKAGMVSDGLAEATINRRLAAVKSLVSYAQRIGRCQWSLEEVKGLKLKTYRDTTGVKVDAYRELLTTCDRSTPKGLRDYAILRLLWDNGLRRGEVAATNVEDFDPEGRTLDIIGKGQGTQKQKVSLSAGAVLGVSAWLEARRGVEPFSSTDPLFVACDRAYWGHRLTTTAIYKMVRAAGEAAEVGKRLSPHRLRHSSITAALDATGGDVRRVQKLSRHAKLDTLMIYDDARKNAQGEVTELLGALVD